MLTATVPHLAAGPTYYFAGSAMYGDGLESTLTDEIEVMTRVGTPVISPPGGIFAGSVSVTILSDTPDATIRYTTDGSQPSASSQRYTGPFTVSASAPVLVRAFKESMADSEIGVAFYEVWERVSTPVISPAGGIYTGSVLVEIHTDTPGAIICYTTDGRQPSPSSRWYDGPITVSASLPVLALAFKRSMANSEIGVAFYEVMPGTLDTAQIQQSNPAKEEVREPDLNHDGQPDAWEIAQFGAVNSTLPTADDDADGVSNLEEYIAGTSPRDAASYPMVNIEVVDGRVAVAYYARRASGTGYAGLQRLFTLEKMEPGEGPNDGRWFPVPGQADVPGLDQVQHFTLPASTSSTTFFRTRARLQ